MSKDYSDILNRKKTSDRLADAFTDQANSMRPMNVGQRREQALLRGLGVGFGIDPEREAKLAELENMSKELAMNKYALEMQSGRNAKIKVDNENFFLNNPEDLAMMSDAIVSGNHTQVDMLAPDILSSYQKITGYGKDMTYKHYKNGLYTFEKADGTYNTINVKDLFAPVYDNLPDEQKKRYRGFASRRQLVDMEAEEALRTLKMQELRSRIENTNADTELVRAKTSSAREEMLNPPMTESQKILFKANVDNNQEYLKEAGKKNITNLALVQTLNELEEMIIESAKKGQVGSDISAIRKRGWDKYISGDNKEMTIVDMAKATYFGRIKEAGGSNPSTTEFLTALSTMPNTDKNLSANLRIINKDRDNALRNILKFNKMEKNLRDREYQGSPYDPAVHGFSDEEYNNFRKENNKNKVVVIRTAKLGTPLAEPEVAEIGADELENYIADGFEIYYE
jgi:hypothetical protein